MVSKVCQVPRDSGDTWVIVAGLESAVGLDLMEVLVIVEFPDGQATQAVESAVGLDTVVLATVVTLDIPVSAERVRVDTVDILGSVVGQDILGLVAILELEFLGTQEFLDIQDTLVIRESVAIPELELLDILVIRESVAIPAFLVSAA